MEGFTF
jgi:hypothetical protein